MTDAPFVLTVPRSDGNSLQPSVSIGECLFVLGANGTGKSALMHRFYNAHRDRARRISAHRQLWFQYDHINLSPEARWKSEENIRNTDLRTAARWSEQYAPERPAIVMYDVVDAENAQGRRTLGAVRAGEGELANKIGNEDTPIQVINDLLRLSNLPIEVSIADRGRIVARKNEGEAYSISQLSDGERAALLIAGSVLTAPASTLLLIDEPERHLHRSIIAPLLTQLFQKRSDCAFVISTHEVTLPLESAASETLLVRGCTFEGPAVRSWEADRMPPHTEVDEELKRDILGGRRKMVFVEGTTGSLDQPLYSLVLPQISVVPKSSCREVEHSVRAIREAKSLHWLDVWGIVDQDGRTETQIASLKAKGVHALPFFSVESLYYHPEVRKRVAKRLAPVIDKEAEGLVELATRAALASLSDPHKVRLCGRAVENTVREMLFRHLPTSDDIIAGTPINIAIDVAEEVAKEKARFEQALAAKNLLTVVVRYPIRETPAPERLAKKLGFQDRNQYEGAVRKLLTDDQEALQLVRSFFSSLVEEMGIAEQTGAMAQGSSGSG